MMDTLKSQNFTKLETHIDVHDTSNKPTKNNCHNNVAIRVLLIVILIICVPILSAFIAIIVFPLLLITLLVTRLIQFIRHDEHGYIKAFQIKLIIRNALFIDVLLILLGLGLIVLAIICFEYHHKIQESDANLVSLIGTLCGFYLLSFLLLKSVHSLLLKRTRPHVVEAISEIIDCLILLVAVFVAKDQIKINDTYYEDGETIFGHPFDEIDKYFTGIEVIIVYLIGYNIITLFTHFVVLGVSVISRPNNHKYDMIFEKVSKKYLVYYAKGLKWSIDFVLSMLMLLVVWVEYMDEDVFDIEDELANSHAQSPAPAPISFPVHISIPAHAQAPGPAPSVLKDLIKGKGVWGFVAWSIVSLLICAFFWLFKTTILLSWKAHTTYERLYDKILNYGKELYYLCAFGEKFYIFKEDEQDLGTKEEMEKILLDKNVGSNRNMDHVERIAQYFLLARNHLNKKKYISDLLQKVSDLNEKKTLSQEVNRIINNSKVNKKEEGEKQTLRSSSEISFFGKCVHATFHFICFSNIQPIGAKENNISPKKEKKEDESINSTKKEKIEEENKCGKEAHALSPIDDGKRLDLELFNDGQQVLKKENISPKKEKEDDEIINSTKKEETEVENKCGKEAHVQSPSDDEKGFVGKLFSDGQQVVRAHNRCMTLANTLSSAKEVASCLNNIIVVIIIVATFIIWLLLTKLCTTEVLIVFGSSLLAGTFVFGNTCKNLFQSILFVFVVHPFDVADLCVVDDILMEVKDIGIWKTTFSKVGCQEEVIYPNTQLSNKKIINHKSDIDWNDHIELEISSLDKKKILDLQTDIEKYLKGDKINFAAGYNCVEIKESLIGNNLKVVIDFKHNANLENSTYFECVKEKRKRRSQFVLYIRNLVNQKDIRGLIDSSGTSDATYSKPRPSESKDKQDDDGGDDDGGDDDKKDDKDEKKSEDKDGKEEPKHKEGCTKEKENCCKEDCNCPKCVEGKVETNDNDNNDNEAYKDGSEITQEQRQSDFFF